MHTQSSSTTSSENALTNVNVTDRIHDPIIQEMLSNRVLEEKVNQNDETERQNRMYHMLVHSKKYRRLSIQRANVKWPKESQEIEPTDDAANSESVSSAADRHVHFAEKVENIPTTGRPEIAGYIRGFLRF